MLYHDPLYGSIDIDEPVLLAVMDSQAVQRLKTVLQHGVTALMGITRRTTRFEHSVGVMLLVRRLGGSLDEQIAALLHDVSHTAFSHVIDYVFNNHVTQGYHEEMKEAHLAASDLPGILAGYGYDWRRYLHEEDFSLLEQPSPHLCADRLDYFLRDGLGLGLATQQEVDFALQHLVVEAGRIVCDNLAAARWMGATFMRADHASWSNFREVGLYELAAQAIRLGLQKGCLSEAVLWTGDEQAWDQLKSCLDPELQHIIAQVSAQTEFAWDADAPTFWVSTKIRTIDPDVLIDDRVLPLSALDADFDRARKEYIARKSGRWPVRVIVKG